MKQQNPKPNDDNFANAMFVCSTLPSEELLRLNLSIQINPYRDAKNYFEWVTAISIQLIRKDEVYTRVCYN